MKKLLIHIVLLLITSSAVAQNFPIASSVFIAPPYSVYLSDYASASSQKMTVNLLLKDVAQQGIQVKLRLTIKGNGIELRTRAEYAAQPIILSGGVLLQLSGIDLQPYLHPDNFDYSGISKSEFIKTGKLPEGVYQFIVETVEYRRSVPISNPGMTLAWLVLNDPPRWILPQDNAILTPTYPQNIFFSWMPMNTASPNSAFDTEYEFSMVEIWPKDRNPGDAINSTTPIFKTVTNNTSLLYGPGEPELTPGRRYVCRVRARDTQGRDLFKNKGYSEILVFTYGLVCKTPVDARHEVTGTETARLDWTASEENNSFTLSYSEQNPDGTWSEWYHNESTIPWGQIEGLKPGTVYRYQVKAQCPDVESKYTEISEFKTQEQDTTEVQCGQDLSIPIIDDSPPLQTLKPGDKINVGGFKASITECTGSAGTFSGKCVVHTKTFGPLRVYSEFDGIGINQSMQVTSGEIKSVKGELNLISVDKIIADIGDMLDNDNTDPNVGQPYKPGDEITIIFRGETFTTTESKIFTSKDGTEIEVKLEDGATPVVIINGKSTEITTDKLDFDNPKVINETEDRPLADTTKYAINYIEFSAYKNSNTSDINLFGFDSYPRTLPQLVKEYDTKKVLDQDYIIPWQSAEANGKPAWVNMHIQTQVPDSIQTRLKVEMNGQPLTFTISPQNDTIRILNLNGQGHKDRELITANYIDDKGEEIPVGYINLVSYQRQDMKLIVMPVDGKFNYSRDNVKKYLNNVYAPAITAWDAILSNDTLEVNYNEGEANGLNTSRTFFSPFNKEMKAVIDAMESRGDYDKDAYYLFVMDKAENESLNGLMPFGSHYGFLFTGDKPSETKLFRTMMHELGHEAFKLKHIFDEKSIEKRATQNLMDYTNNPETANILHKYQWDEIIDPRVIAFGWSEEMYSEEYKINPREKFEGGRLYEYIYDNINKKIIKSEENNAYKDLWR